jgi:hypothetical protein
VRVLPLLEDGSLRLEVQPALLPTLELWFPLVPTDGATPRPLASLALVASSLPPPPPPPGRRTLALGRVDAWVDGERALLSGRDGVHGEVDLGAREGELRVPLPGGDAVADLRTAWEVHSACTLGTALLLGRMARGLAHAAAVAPPAGAAWLLVGDTHAGKTTTCVTLLSRGWSYVSDDHVVLRRGGDGVPEVEGLPRRFHIDEGWERGETLHRRGVTDPRVRWPGRWRRSAPIAGVLLPRVEAELPTRLEPVAAADVLAALLRQSPWLLADASAAPAVLELMREVSLLPARRLRLGLDAYRDPDRLMEALRPVTGGG